MTCRFNSTWQPQMLEVLGMVGRQSVAMIIWLALHCIVLASLPACEGNQSCRMTGRYCLQTSIDSLTYKQMQGESRGRLRAFLWIHPAFIWMLTGRPLSTIARKHFTHYSQLPIQIIAEVMLVPHSLFILNP